MCSQPCALLCCLWEGWPPGTQCQAPFPRLLMGIASGGHRGEAAGWEEGQAWLSLPISLFCTSFLAVATCSVVPPLPGNSTFSGPAPRGLGGSGNSQLPHLPSLGGDSSLPPSPPVPRHPLSGDRIPLLSYPRWSLDFLTGY